MLFPSRAIPSACLGATVEILGIPDIVKDLRECLIIPPHSVEAIEGAIVQLMSNPVLGREMSTRGHQLVAINFTWAQNAAKYSRLYESLLGNAAARSSAELEAAPSDPTIVIKGMANR